MSDAQPAGAQFGRVPACWLDHPAIGTDELAVLTVLAVHAGRDGVCCVRQSVLADRLKRSREWVNRIIARLARLDGVLEKERRADRDGWTVACRYRLPDLAVCKPDTPDVTGGAHPEQTLGNKDSSSLSRARVPSEPDSRVADSGEELIAATDTTAAPVLPPADWQPDAEDRAWLAEHRPDLDATAMTTIFVAGCHARGLHYTDLSAAWRLWASRQWPPRPSRRPTAAATQLFPTRPVPVDRASLDENVAGRIIARMTARRAGQSLEM